MAALFITEHGQGDKHVLREHARSPAPATVRRRGNGRSALSTVLSVLSFSLSPDSSYMSRLKPRLDT